MPTGLSWEVVARWACGGGLLGTAGKCVPVCAVQLSEYDALGGGSPTFCISGPHWKKSCLGHSLNTQTLMKTEEQKIGFK